MLCLQHLGIHTNWCCCTLAAAAAAAAAAADPQVADEWIDTLFPSQKKVQLQRLADWKDTRKAIAVCHNW
jgi:hypothetical protein